MRKLFVLAVAALVIVLLLLVTRTSAPNGSRAVATDRTAATHQLARSADAVLRSSPRRPRAPGDVVRHGSSAVPPPVHFRKWPFGPADETQDDFRRNLWEELQSYADDAKLTDEQRARFLSDLVDLADEEAAFSDKITGTVNLQVMAAQRRERNATTERELEERLSYLTDDQWRLFQRRFIGWASLPFRLASGYVLERG